MKVSQTTTFTPIFSAIQQQVLSPIAQGQPVETEVIYLTENQQNCLMDEMRTNEPVKSLPLKLQQQDGSETEVKVRIITE